MNLNEERNYQKMLEVLDALELTEKNRQLAEQYLDTSQPENRELLSQVERQDFSRLDREKRKLCATYRENCQARDREEAAERYVRFVAAVGGSTSLYVLVTYGNLNTILQYLTREQTAAIRAESRVWNDYLLKGAVQGLEQKDPKVLRGAMELCCHKSDNAKVLLAGVSLLYSKPVKVQGGSNGWLISGGDQEEEQAVQKTVDYLLENLTASIPNMFIGGTVSEDEKKILRDFVRESKPDEPIPASVYEILKGKRYHEYLITLLSGMAFLAIEHSEQFTAFLRLSALMDRENQKMTTLDICKEIHGYQWFADHIEALEDSLPFNREDYAVWCVNAKAEHVLRRLSVQEPEAVRQAMFRVSTDGMPYLLNCVKKGNPKLYQELLGSYTDDYRVRVAEELADCYKTGRTEILRYLLGEAELKVLYPYIKELRGGWIYTTLMGKVAKLGVNGSMQTYRRALVLMGILQQSAYFNQYWVDVDGEHFNADGRTDKFQKATGHRFMSLEKQQIQNILHIFAEEQVPVMYQLEAMAGIYDGFYQESDKASFMDECVRVVASKKVEWSDALTAGARDGIALVRCLCIRALDMYWTEYKDVLLACAQDSSKQVRELLEAVYASHREWEKEIVTMLGSKKSQEREMAVLVLKKWGTSAYQAELSLALEKEKSKKIKELIQGSLGMDSTELAAEQEKTADELAAELLKGGKKRKVMWAYETSFPQVHKLDGSKATDDYMQAILVAYADMNPLGVNADAARLAGALEPQELSAYMNLLFGKWMEAGAEAKKKWVLYAASIHGGEAMVPVLYAQIQEWPNAARGAMAAEAVRALALNGSSTALLQVDQISRKFKFRQVKAAAGEALTYAAEQLGISKAELEDRIVPNLGFDERMEQIFDYGTRKFTVVLTPALELQVTDESGKKLKSLPTPGKRDEEEKAKAASDAFKLLKKQFKTVVTNQKLRLEQALSSERLWPTAQWTELFVKNPVMHQFAIGLIWGLYENGELKDTFRYMEDGSFNTVDEDEYDFPEHGLIGLVHPIELEKEALEAWKEQLSDYEITQPIEQLERTIYQVEEEELDATELTRFGGKILNSLSLSGKLLGMGWYRGSVQDAGGYYTFYREDGEIGVELEFSGSFVGYDDSEVTVYGAQFYKAGTVKRGSYVYDTVKKENRYTLGQVSARYFSEIVLQLSKATASSKEQVAYPECKGR